jgi:hypothetical protein
MEGTWCRARRSGRPAGFPIVCSTSRQEPCVYSSAPHMRPLHAIHPMGPTEIALSIKTDLPQKSADPADRLGRYWRPYRFRILCVLSVAMSFRGCLWHFNCVTRAMLTTHNCGGARLAHTHFQTRPSRRSCRLQRRTRALGPDAGSRRHVPRPLHRQQPHLHQRSSWYRRRDGAGRR